MSVLDPGCEVTDETPTVTSAPSVGKIRRKRSTVSQLLRTRSRSRRLARGQRRSIPDLHIEPTLPPQSDPKSRLRDDSATANLEHLRAGPQIAARHHSKISTDTSETATELKSAECVHDLSIGAGASSVPRHPDGENPTPTFHSYEAKSKGTQAGSGLAPGLAPRLVYTNIRTWGDCEIVLCGDHTFSGPGNWSDSC